MHSLFSNFKENKTSVPLFEKDYPKSVWVAGRSDISECKIVWPEREEFLLKAETMALGADKSGKDTEVAPATTKTGPSTNPEPKKKG